MDFQSKEKKLIYNLLDFLPLNVDYEKSTDTPKHFLKALCLLLNL